MARILVPALFALPVLLSARMPGRPLYGPDTPRNGAGLPVDSHYGTTLPGVYKWD
ncbi:MAG TPA: hypothetical protein VLX85_14180 [Stellaceae bacterium]|nr:hypothetical protein [Stellaceae bacterium]